MSTLRSALFSGWLPACLAHQIRSEDRRRPVGTRERLRDNLAEWFLRHVGERAGELYDDIGEQLLPVRKESSG